MKIMGTKKIGIGLLGLGTVGAGVVKILQSPEGRHPLVSEIDIVRIAVKNIDKKRPITIESSLLTQDPIEVVDDPNTQVIVEVMGGIDPARELILRAISKGKSVVTANKALIARHGEEIANAANSSGVYVLIEAAVGGGIPIIEPLKQSLGGNKITKVSGIINGTTNYILSRMSKEGANYNEVLKDAQRLGYAEADPAADVEGLDAADKISILSGLAFGGAINREQVPTQGIDKLKSQEINYANQLGYGIKLLAIAESLEEATEDNSSQSLALWVEPTLVPNEHPLAGVNGVNNAIFIEGEPIGKVMFYGPGAGAGPTASAVVADILNIAGVKVLDNSKESALLLDPLLSAASWRSCHLVNANEIIQKSYVRLFAEDSPGVIGQIGSIFGEYNVSIQSIVQFDANEVGAEIVVITHEVKKGQVVQSLSKIKELPEVKSIEAHMGCL
tara:strand:- start:10617 stop:11954 length:1338 start_codon:yes stop_codon:yes gene_type:complete